MGKVIKLGLLALMSLLFVAGCSATEPEGQPQLTFHALLGTCGAGATEADISVVGDKVIFCGTLETPTPCYKLEAELELVSRDRWPDVLIVKIYAHEQGGACVQCIGEVAFNGEVGPLDSGEYDLMIMLEDGSIIGQRVEVE